jgi:hypothetical protein
MLNLQKNKYSGFNPGLLQLKQRNNACSYNTDMIYFPERNTTTSDVQAF